MVDYQFIYHLISATLVPCAENGALGMTCMKRKCLMNENPKMLNMRYYSKKTFSCQNISLASNEILKSETKCIHLIKANHKHENLLKQICGDKIDYVKSLLLTKVKWLSNSNNLKNAWNYLIS